MEAVATQGSSSKVCSAFALTGEQATQGVLETEKRGVWGLGGESPSVALCWEANSFPLGFLL
jgi:hypothetical protein